MGIGSAIKKEKEDFKYLYKGIENEVVRERIRASGEWYIEHAIKYKRKFYIFSIIGIVAPLLITVINSKGGATEGTCFFNIRVVTAICSVLASFSSTFLAISKCKEKWTIYRNAVEQIKNALTLYAIEKGDENKRLERLVERTESIMQEEQDRWNTIVKERKEADGVRSTQRKENEREEQDGE